MDDVLRIEPILGRFYGPEEDQPDGPRAMLLSKGFWEQEFGGDPNVLGKTVSLNGYPIEFHLEWSLLIGCVVVAIAVAAAASLLPARRAARMRIIGALQYE